MFNGLQERINGVFYKCEYLKEYKRLHHNAEMGEIVTVVNIEKETTKKTLSVCLNKFHC